jgi:hypothetical protein
LGHVAAIGEDAAIVLRAADQDIGGVRRDDEFHREKRDRHERHASGHAAHGVVEEIALTALGLVGHAAFEDLLILRGQRRLLSTTPGLGLIERRLAAGRADSIVIDRRAFRHIARPRAAPVRVFGILGRMSGTDHRQRRAEHKGNAG